MESPPSEGFLDHRFSDGLVLIGKIDSIMLTISRYAGYSGKKDQQNLASWKADS